MAIIGRHYGLLAALLLHAPAVMACTACFGDPDSSQTQGMNAAIITLLLVTFGVLMVAGGVVLQIMMRVHHRADGSTSPSPTYGRAPADSAREEA